MIKIAVVGLGKMGLSHLAIARAHSGLDLVAVCDPNSYVTGALAKYAHLKHYSTIDELFRHEALNAVIIATPSHLHGSMVRAALEKGLHVFCEKPFSLNPIEGKELVELASSYNLVNQVGYHYRFVGTFRELRRLVVGGALGTVHSFRIEAYGPVILKPKGSTWRLDRSRGGGCLLDYACHALDLVNYVLHMPEAVGGTALLKIFSKDVEDAVYSTLFYPSKGISGQLAANWSDDSFRKMSTRMTVWGTNGHVTADRQEIQLYLRETNASLAGYVQGWNIRNVTELTGPVEFYVRGEEYSAQIDHFVQTIQNGGATISTFRDALETDTVVKMLVSDSNTSRGAAVAEAVQRKRQAPASILLRRLLGLVQ